MITPRDLRIGNILREYYFDYSTDSTDWIHIEVNAMDIRNLCDNPDRFNDLTMPIDLDEEWLLKAGFIRDVHLEILENNNLKQYMIGDRSSVNFFRICYHPIGGYTFSFRGTPIAKLSYVHQLQNLIFALSGEELTFNKNA
jgi:hypothetical protein